MYHNSYKTLEDDITRFIELEVSLPFEITKENLIVTHETVAESRKRSYKKFSLMGLDQSQEILILNPYSETENKLVTLDSGEYVDPEIEKSLKNLTIIGEKLHSEYVKERIENCSKPISDIFQKQMFILLQNLRQPN